MSRQPALRANRRDALREYLQAVVRDLVTRGVIRFQSGEAWPSVMQRELQVILGEVSSDFGAVFAELGVGFLNGLGSLVGSFLARRR